MVWHLDHFFLFADQFFQMKGWSVGFSQIGPQMGLYMAVVLTSIIIYLVVQMKKNVNKLLLMVGETVKPRGKRGFQINCQNAHEYTNKIAVDAKEYRRQSVTERFIDKEMESYPTSVNPQVKEVENNIKKKTGKVKTIEQKLAELSTSKLGSILHVEDVIVAIRFASKSELEKLRPKLIKLENDIGFKLEDEEMEGHVR